MFKKIYASFLIGLGLFSSTPTKTTFSIVSHSNESSDIALMYEYKNKIIEDYSKMILGMKEDEIISDLLLLYPEMSYENHCLTYVIGDGKGKQISGELKSNYCDVEVKPKSFFEELFN